MTIPQTYASDPRDGDLVWAVTASARIFLHADERRTRLDRTDGPHIRTSRVDALDALAMAMRACRTMEPVPWWQFDELFAGGPLTDYVFEWMHGPHTHSVFRGLGSLYGPGEAYILRKTCLDMQAALDDMRAT